MLGRNGKEHGVRADGFWWRTKRDSDCFESWKANKIMIEDYRILLVKRSGVSTKQELRETGEDVIQATLAAFAPLFFLGHVLG